jgi:hypothetical protein
MIIEPQKTIEDLEKVLASILELQANPYCDCFMFMSLVEKREKVEAKIAELKAEGNKMKKIPEPLYPCKYCDDEYSWPAKDLHWSEEIQDWVCGECWCYSVEGEQGISLADEIKAQSTEPKREKQ